MLRTPQIPCSCSPTPVLLLLFPCSKNTLGTGDGEIFRGRIFLCRIFSQEVSPPQDIPQKISGRIYISCKYLRMHAKNTFAFLQPLVTNGCHWLQNPSRAIWKLIFQTIPKPLDFRENPESISWEESSGKYFLEEYPPGIYSSRKYSLCARIVWWEGVGGQG